jgi:hypothetical protein
MFVWTCLLRITHTIISQSSADSSWITLYIWICALRAWWWLDESKHVAPLISYYSIVSLLWIGMFDWHVLSYIFCEHFGMEDIKFKSIEIKCVEVKIKPQLLVWWNTSPPPNFYITAQINRFMLSEKIATVHCENHNKHASTVLEKYGISQCERRWCI